MCALRALLKELLNLDLTLLNWSFLSFVGIYILSFSYNVFALGKYSLKTTEESSFGIWAKIVNFLKLFLKDFQLIHKFDLKILFGQKNILLRSLSKHNNI